jgi:CHAD domain-containing protein
VDSLAGDGHTSTRHAQRILRKEIRRAARKLNGSTTGNGDIHDARRHIKRARATLRLMRSSLTVAAYRAEDKLLSRASRPLGIVRDDKILIDNLDKVLSHYRGAEPILGTQTLRVAFLTALERDRTRIGTKRHGLSGARRLLRKARRQAAKWPTHRRDGKHLVEDVRRLYRAGRRALNATRQETSDEHLHALRKRAKYLSHQLRLFAPKSTSRLGRIAQGFHQLSDELGDDHDLALLRAQVTAHLRDLPDPESETRLVALIDQARTALTKKALLRAEALYGDKSGRFARAVRKGCREPARTDRAAAETRRRP